MGSYLSTEILNEFQKINRTQVETIRICKCGDYAPFIKGGSCRHCYGFLK